MNKLELLDGDSRMNSGNSEPASTVALLKALKGILDRYVEPMERHKFLLHLEERAKAEGNWDALRALKAYKNDGGAIPLTRDFPAESSGAVPLTVTSTKADSPAD
ncbi:hypothetical protein [Prosthecomicrobium hirschii]|uniref:hypothetical protein n=1 Tax=Prosthecodimorpha hirschii TaxID=665126 RepID=UPI0022211080|nr:hypothetical protein [Prosthecomicrobium hirschii]MCW1839813.1 hypothetical protein [Prosthecomicrobium hirschii]